MVYHINGGNADVEGQSLLPRYGMQLDPSIPVNISAGDEPVRVLILQGKPIDEPVVKYGPFVMNTNKEIVEAFADYRATQFGGWPWGAADVVHPREQGRFAQMADGKKITPE